MTPEELDEAARRLSSGRAIMALEEGENRLAALKAEIRREALEEAAKIVEEFDVPLIKLAAKYGPSFPTSKPYADAIRERAKE